MMQLTRPPRNKDELYHLVTALWGVVIPRHKVCPEHIAPFDAFADAYFNIETRPDGTVIPSMGTALWHGSRGLSGKSFMLSILGLTKTVIQGSDTNLLGGSLAQSANIHEHMRGALEYPGAPTEMIKDNTNTMIKFTNNAKIRPLTASQKTVRGPHPAFLLLDEIDEMDQEILDAALGQPMDQRNWARRVVKPYSVLCSTWQNPDGTFTTMKRRYEEEGLPIKTWCYRESNNKIDGWLTDDAIDLKKRTVSKEMWRVEYELGEPSIGNRAFDTEAVERTFSLEFAPIAKKVEQDYEEYWFEAPQRGGTYVVGADWAREHDYTVVTVIRTDVEPYGQLVYYLRLNRRPYPFMVGKYNEAMHQYHATGLHDGTGLGQVIEDLVDMRSDGFYFTGAQRSDLLSEMVLAIEHDRFRLPQIPTLYSAFKYCRVGDLYSGSTKDFHLPDEVSAMALANRLMGRVGVSAPWVVDKDLKAQYRLAKELNPETGESDPLAAPLMGEVTSPSQNFTGTISLMV